MKKIFQMMSLVTLLLVMCTSMAFAATHTKKIAVVPLQAVNCRYGTMTDEIMEDLNGILKDKVDASINGVMTRVDIVDPEEAMNTFQKVYQEKKAVNSKAKYRDAVALTARELKADLIIVPVAENCYSETSGGIGSHRVINYAAFITVYVYDKTTGTTNTFKASDNYHGYDMEGLNFKDRMEMVLSAAVKKAKISDTVEMVVTSW